jgi:hypothetical protein
MEKLVFDGKDRVKTIDELLDTPIPKKLWHYTSTEGFHGIVTSGTFFATDLRFLNDRREFVHLKAIAESVINEVPDHKTGGTKVRDAMKVLCDKAFDRSLGKIHLEIFVASFSAAEDQLSQWRGYSSGTSGVCIGFDLESFRPPKNLGILASFAPCVYDTALQRELVVSTLQPFRNEIEGNLDKIHGSGLDAGAPASQFYQAATRLFVALWTIAALSKDPSFREEAEWRLVLPLQPDRQPPPDNPPKFRIRTTTLIPYIAHPNPPRKPLPIVDVILGPGSHEHSVAAVEAFLKSNGINVTPRQSTVPYLCV